MTSRLDRLFILLDTGSSPVTRRAAALQLGEVQKLHPHELHNLLAKVHNYLHSSQWETRIAAGEAVEAIISNVPQWDPPGIKSEKEMKEASLSMTGRLKFEQFDINKVLKNGACLLASEGKEYELEEPIGLEQKERLAKQRHLLNKRLGLDGAERLGFDTSDIFSNDDLVIVAPSEKQNKNLQLEMNKKAIAEIVQAEMSALGPGLSSREINRAKRKAKLVAKQRSRETSEASGTATSNNKSDTDEPEQKKKRTSSIIVEKTSQDEAVIVENIENSSLWEESGEWPFEFFCDQLSQDLFNHLWEVRHGAATALREIIRVHGRGAGKTIDMSKSQMELNNQLWLEDIALRLLCALALDRFGDFISDQVVAPVRETCAQTLASTLNIMNKESVRGVTQILLQLLKQPEWEARHGGLLGMKYLLAVRNDMTSELLPLVFPPIFEGLKDEIDDVCAVAAAALVPISDFLIKDLSHEVPGIISTLWSLLLEQDDLTTSTNSIMTLLASLLSHPVTLVHYSPTCPLNELVPRLWPFLGHNSSSVRKSALQTLLTLASKNCSESPNTWITFILSDALRHVYQRCILEHVFDVLELVFTVWKCLITHSPLSNLLTSACPSLSSWICLMMQPAQIPILPEFLIEAKHKVKEKLLNKTRHSSASDGNIKDIPERYYIGGVETLNDPSKEREHCVIRARCWAAKLIGFISCYISQPMPGYVYTTENESPSESYAKLLLFHLNSKSALQKMTIALLIIEWANQDSNCLCSMTVKKRLLECLNENIYYDEIALMFTRLQQECRDFISILQQHNLHVDPLLNLGTVIPIEKILEMMTSFHLMIQNVKIKPKVLEMLEERRKSLLNSATQTNYEQLNLHIAVQATIAGAVVALNFLPDKLNPIVKPLMDAVKKEEKELLQSMAATSLTRLLELCLSRPTCPNAKIIKNLCSFVTADPNFTPKIQQADRPQMCTVTCKEGRQSLISTPVNYNDTYSGILTLVNLQKHAEKTLSNKRSGALSKNKNPVVEVNVEDNIMDDESNHQNELQGRGAQFALIEIAQKFGETLPEKLPKLWEAFLGPLTEIVDPQSFDPSKFIGNDVQAQELVNALQVLEVIGPALHLNLSKEIVEKYLPHLCLCLEHPYTAVRHMAARCIGMLSKTVTVETMNSVLEIVVPSLESTDNDIRRLGAIETVANVIDSLDFTIVPYIVLLVIPVLGRMSDPNSHVRLMATHCFATLIRLMPLENVKQDFISLTPKLMEKKNKERHFLEQLFDTKKLKNYKMPVPINAELRAYQQDGVNWLSFLNKYKLHGILCDDMGLGKTLQSICILAGDHYDRETEFKRTESPEYSSLPSIVICPPTLTGHWVYEVGKFINKKYLNSLHYTGPPAERQRLRSYFNKSKKHNLVIVSYDLVRNDIEFFSSLRWNYCILDEGHIIKNGKTKLSKAIKQLVANHRLILSGTPIQNNVLELWSLFDFLMPGFLGTEKQFTARYSKPILLSRDAKSSSKEQEAGALAMESLHRQVLPFLLRRMKEDVLQDLPPKIIQDYYCELSPLQEQLYEDFSKSRAKQSLEDKLSQEESFNTQSFSHIFQALQYLRKVCNHPKLVLNSSHPEYENINKKLKEQNSSFSDINHAAKLLALKQLLLDCGIGVDSSTSESPESVVNQHRALIFCQLKSMLDILEKDLLKIHLPSVTYLRLDGSIPPGSRYSVVHRFNNDPSIDVLLLTTRVGGLGLNLTGADTVIFVEHDWNPMKDLQAMDRAHRIGQKKVVNVYRLITKGTLEEKIMGLQKFKLTIANTVISQENSNLLSMGTDQLLDLFILEDNKKSGSSEKGKNKTDNSKSAVKNVLESLPELWDEKQYETEYDLSNFMQNLKKIS